jgi:putative ATP-dependent endonuclease of the OLD family
MRISRVQIENFRNFHHLDVAVGEHAVIVGENKIGKSNLIFALRLLMDPSLPDSARQLKEEDFWDGLPRPLTKGDVIQISLQFADFEDEDKFLAVLGEYPISSEPMVSRLTYIFGPTAVDHDEPIKESDYEFFIYGGDKPDARVGSDFRRRLPLDLLPALRDAEGDLANWRRSPLRPLLDEVASRIDRTVLETIAQEISDATDAVTETTEVSGLADEITSRITDMVGSSHALEMTLGFSPTEPDRLLRALRLFIDDGKRGVGDASLGSANLLYLALKALELEQLVEKKKRDHTFLAIEEPEAHLHPHLQRLVYRDFLRRRTHQEAGAKGEAPLLATSILMTTHSPHIVSVSPLKSIILLRKAADEDSSEGLSAAEVELEEDEREDLERYLDVSRGEMLFAKGVLLVEGEAEMYVVPALGKLIGYDFDELGITVCSVAGTNFAPYVKLLRPNGLNIPFAVLTDFDPQDEGKNLGEKRVLNLLQNVVPAKKLGGKETAELLKLAPQKGLFLNEYTFEVDLFKCGRHKSMCKTLSDLTEFKKVVERAEEWKNDPSKLDPERFLGDIEKIGKGRFAQRLAGNMTGKLCPVYIKEAIEYVVNLCH